MVIAYFVWQKHPCRDLLAADYLLWATLGQTFCWATRLLLARAACPAHPALPMDEPSAMQPVPEAYGPTAVVHRLNRACALKTKCVLPCH
jgi:hypothetical protein